MRTSVKILLQFILLTTVWSQEQHSYFQCDNTFCIDAHLNSPCPVKRNCTTQGTRTYLTPEKCNCCEGTFCIEYKNETDTCEVDSVNPALVDLCGPQLTCDSSSKKCGPMTSTKCAQERYNYDQNFKTGAVGTAQFKPECDAVGRYTNRQCLPGSVCFCVNEQGQRIFGVGLVTKLMNCKCARDVENLKLLAGMKGLLPRCMPNGDYDPIQCVGRQCWCLQKPATKVKISDIDELACYDKNEHPMMPTPYRRPCEYAKSLIEVELIQAKNESRLTLIADYPNCDLDGNYSPLQPRKDKLICVDQRGQQIDHYEIAKNSPVADKVDCYCARVQQLMLNNVNGKPVCCPNGNFRKWQCSGSICYCVDRDGKQIIIPGSDLNEVHKDDVNQLTCYQDSNDECAY